MATPSPSPGPSPSAVPSIDELMEEAKKIPSMEELEAAAQGLEPAAAQPAMPPEFSGEELAAGAFRAALGGATAGIAEPAYFMPLDAVMGAIASYARNSEFDKAKGLIERMQEGVAEGYSKQKAIEAKYPTTAATLEMAAGAIPAVGPAKIGATAAEKAIRAGMRAVPEFGAGALKAEKPLGALAELGVAGAKGGLAMASGEEVERGAAELAGVKGAQGTPEEMAKRVGVTMAGGAVAAPAFGGLIAGGMALEPKIRAFGLSDGAKNIVRFLFGSPVKTQEKYLRDPRFIDSLPPEENIVNVFQEVKDFAKEEFSASKIEFDKAVEQLAEAERASEKAKKVNEEFLNEKLAGFKDQLTKLKDELKRETSWIREEGGPLKAQKAAIREEIEPFKEAAEFSKEKLQYQTGLTERRAREAAQTEIATLRAQRQEPFASPYVRMVEDAVTEVKKNAGLASKEAIETLTDDEFIPVSIIETAIQRQLDETRRVIGISPVSQALQRMLFKMKERVAKSEVRALPGTELKKEIQDLQKMLAGRDVIRFSEPAENALNGIRKDLSDYLKGKDESGNYRYPGYAEKMEPVAKMTAFINDFAAKAFSTPSKIESAIKKSASDPVMQQRFAELENYSGMPISENLAEYYRALEASAPSAINAEIKNLPSVRALERLRDDLLNTTDPAAQARIRAQIPIAEEAARAEIELKQAKDPKRIKELEAELPAMKRLKQIEGLLDLAEAADFEAAVIRTVQDVETAEIIISLRNLIENLKNPERRRIFIQNATLKQTSDLGQAAARERQAKQDFEAWREAYNPISQKETGETIVQAILRNADGPMSDQAVRIMRGLSEIPQKQFEELFKSLGVGSPKDLDKLADALRVRRSLETERIRGSWGVQKYKSIMKPIVSFLGMTDPVNKQALSGTGDAIAGIAGAVGAWMDIKGGSFARAYLRTMADMNGVFTYEKLMKALPDSKRVAGPIGEFVSDLANGARQQPVTEVAQVNRQSLIDDIKASSLSPIKKARASLQVANGFIEGDLLADLLESGMQRASEKPLAARMVEFTQ